MNGLDSGLDRFLTGRGSHSASIKNDNADKC